MCDLTTPLTYLPEVEFPESFSPFIPSSTPPQQSNQRLPEVEFAPREVMLPSGKCVWMMCDPPNCPYSECGGGTYRSENGGIPMPGIPSLHPPSCEPTPEAIPSSIEQAMHWYAGKYKITGTGYAPHCPPNAAPLPLSFYNGWMSLQPYFPANHCDEIFTFSDLKNISFSCVESTKGPQLGFPNTVNGGCGRDFEEYYTKISEPNIKGGGSEGEFTVRVQITESSTLAGNTTTDGTWPWIRVTFNSAQVIYPGTYLASLNLTMYGGGQPIIESNIPDIMNQPVDILEASASTHIDKDGNEEGEWRDHPVYYYVFFENDWPQAPHGQE